VADIASEYTADFVGIGSLWVFGRDEGQRGRSDMATFIILASFTGQGIRNVKDTTKRTDAFKEMAKKCNATVKDTYWLLGPYDMVAICEVPDDETATALALSSSALGNVRTQTLRAFSQSEIDAILGKMV
jgi:uncharacterized protein with GYD domain